MKKLFTGIVTAVLTLSVGFTGVFAAGGGHGHGHGHGSHHSGSYETCEYHADCLFTDDDQDGICDNCGIGTCGVKECHGKGFVDADGDGICDNCGSDTCSKEQCHGLGCVDGDENEICGNFAQGVSRNSQGTHRGCSGGRGRHCR